VFSIDISLSVCYIHIEIKKDLHTDESPKGKRKTMKKILTVLLVMVVAMGFVFATASANSGSGSIKLTTNVDGVSTFGFTTKAVGTAGTINTENVNPLDIEWVASEDSITTTALSTRWITLYSNEARGYSVTVTPTKMINDKNDAFAYGFTMKVGGKSISSAGTTVKTANLSLASGTTSRAISYALSDYAENAAEKAVVPSGSYTATLTLTLKAN
jgi:hypothetical protein